MIGVDLALGRTDRNWSAKGLRRVYDAALTLGRSNVPPSRVMDGLREVDALVESLLATPAKAEVRQLLGARVQARFCILLTLQSAYFELREREVNALLQFSCEELECITTEQVLQIAVKSVAEWTQPVAICLYTRNESDVLRLRANWGAGTFETTEFAASKSQMRSLSGPAKLLSESAVIEKSWSGKAVDCWSVPLPPTGEMAGLFLIAFTPGRSVLQRDIGMLSELSLRCWMALKQVRLAEDLEESGQKMKEIARRMLEVEELERRRISRELHDDPAQALAVIRLQLEMLEMDLSTNSPLREQLLEIRKVTESTIHTVRRLIFDLSPSVLEQLGLGAAVRQLVNRMRKDSDMRVRLTIGKLGQLNQNLQMGLYRIIQECLNNVERHSGAKNVTVLLNANRQAISLTIEDDGKGFVFTQANPNKQQFGLVGIRERVRLLGGQFHLESTSPDSGKNRGNGVSTSVIIVLPLSDDVFKN